MFPSQNKRATVLRYAHKEIFQLYAVIGEATPGGIFLSMPLINMHETSLHQDMAIIPKDFLRDLFLQIITFLIYVEMTFLKKEMGCCNTNVGEQKNGTDSSKFYIMRERSWKKVGMLSNSALYCRWIVKEHKLKVQN